MPSPGRHQRDDNQKRCENCGKDTPLDRTLNLSGRTFMCGKNHEEIMTISKENTIEEVVTKYPESVMVFMKHGLHCVGCHVSAFESIEEGAMAHGINVDALVADLNKIALSKKK
jgi:hybrid cluster-associated redox disulfide protein